MSDSSRISICITAYNEEENIPRLVESMMHVAEEFGPGLGVTIVDNGSTDSTWKVLSELAREKPFEIHQLAPNARYGGGMASAIRFAHHDAVCMLPADNQYSPEDVLRVLFAYREADDSALMVKGRRDERNDPLAIRLMSWVYSALVRSYLRTGRVDVNGLPKVFDRRSLVGSLDELPTSAVFDAGVIALWRRGGGRIIELPVVFSNRVHGQASWSSGRLAVARAMHRDLRNLARTIASGS